MIASLYFQQCMDDKLICRILNEEGYKIAFNTFVQLRLSMKIKRRHSVVEYEARYDQLKAIVSAELDKGTITSLGRTLLATHFRSDPSLEMMIGR